MYILSKKLKQRRLKILMHDFINHSFGLKNAVEFIQDYKNKTKRKNKKLSRELYDGYMNNILSMSVKLCVFKNIVFTNKKLKNRYDCLLKMMDNEIKKQIITKEAGKNEKKIVER